MVGNSTSHYNADKNYPKIYKEIKVNQTKQEMVIPMDKETKHIKDRNDDTQGYSKHEIVKIKTEYTNLMWWNNKVDYKNRKKVH